jgi:hypothetical protein
MLTSRGRKIKDSIKIMDNYAYSIIEQRVAALEEARKTEEGDEHQFRDLLSLFLDAR